MEGLLRCNSLKCRTELTSKAVVTTCSHIFCVPCAEALGLATPNASRRTCPACQTLLSNDDDAVVTELSPSEDYKTSVLSGLHPTVILECAGRGMAFYTYQVHQEIIYQEYLARSLSDKYRTLSDQMDKVIDDANSEIGNLRKKIEDLQSQQQQLEETNQKLKNDNREKSQKYGKLHHQYQKVKAQQMAAGLESAADHDAENAIHGATTGHFTGNQNRHGQPMPSRNGSHGSGASGGRRQKMNNWQKPVQGNRMNTAQSAPVPATPSGHRTSMHDFYGNRATNAAAPAAHDQQPTPHRPAFQAIHPNTYGNSNASYAGMSAGVKMPRQQQQNHQNGPIYRNSAGFGRQGGVGGLNIRH